MRDAHPEPFKAMLSPAALIGLATAVPPTCIRQDQTLQAARQIFGQRFDGFDRMAQVFALAGIDTRHLARPVDRYLQDHGWQDRDAAHLEVAADLFVRSATAALQAAGRSTDQVDVIITLSSTGIATSSLDTLAADRMGFRSDATTIPVFGWGCAGGRSGHGSARQRDRACGVGLCSLSFRRDVLTKENMVATALFGDGVAAAVIGADGTPRWSCCMGPGWWPWPCWRRGRSLVGAGCWPIWRCWPCAFGRSVAWPGAGQRASWSGRCMRP